MKWSRLQKVNFRYKKSFIVKAIGDIATKLFFSVEDGEAK